MNQSTELTHAVTYIITHFGILHVSSAITGVHFECAHASTKLFYYFHNPQSKLHEYVHVALATGCATVGILILATLL